MEIVSIYFQICKNYLRNKILWLFVFINQIHLEQEIEEYPHLMKLQKVNLRNL